MNKKFGFTLSELLFATAVLAILVAILAPTIVKNRPDTNSVITRRAYYTISSTVSDLINNINLYSTTSDKGTPFVGFDDHSQVTYKNKTYGGPTKFVDLFIDHINTKGNIDNDTTKCHEFMSSSENLADCKTVYVNNGSRWSFASPLENDETRLAAIIMIDINGNKKPNCFVGKEGCSKEKGFDQFRVSIRDNGKIAIAGEDVWAMGAVMAGGIISDGPHKIPTPSLNGDSSSSGSNSYYDDEAYDIFGF